MATEEYGTVTFQNGKPVPINDLGTTFEFPDEVETRQASEAKAAQDIPDLDIEIVDDIISLLFGMAAVAQKSAKPAP